MSRLSRFGVIAKHVYTEPRFKAEAEWLHEFGVAAQLGRQVPREEMVGFVAGHGWENPDREIVLEMHEPPDWDWWEPRHDQPWRRKQSRDRELDAKLEAVR
jgi:hypothetical protein